MKEKPKPVKKAAEKPAIKITVVSKSVIVKIDKQAYTLLASTKEQIEEIKKVVASINKQRTDAKVAKLIKMLTPKQEAAKTEKLAVKKLTKKKIEKTEKEIKALDKAITSNKDSNPLTLDSTLEEVFRTDKRFILEADGSVYLAPFMIALPSKLVEKIRDFIIRNVDIQPLINFWKLCLLNPNPIARTKLFDYLTLHNLIITPNGYFVTYRMVKTTKDKGVYTHAHNGDSKTSPRLYYEVGKVAKLDRAQFCDEDGNKDCSRGIHFGSPRFIGIVEKVASTTEDGKGVGEGYGVKTVTTKAAHRDSYGTGYDRPSAPTTQTFNNTFGNVATLWLINPMHVVSIPNSDTRKMRACEGYFAKLTTPEEVIQHVIDPDFLLFDSQYKTYEEDEINKMLKATKLIAYKDAEKNAKTQAAKTKAQANLKKLKESLNISGDPVSHKDLSIEEVRALIQSRVKKV